MVTPSSAGLAADATNITIAGLGFDSNIANDSVTFDNGVTGSVIGATSTSLTVSVSGLDSVTAGTALNANVTVDAPHAAPVQVATINPVVTPSSAGLSADATSITIAGLGFDSNIANDSVNFDNGVTGSVTGATSTSLTVSVSGLDSVTAGTQCQCHRRWRQ